jgi:hypothetical protein
LNRGFERPDIDCAVRCGAPLRGDVTVTRVFGCSLVVMFVPGRHCSSRGLGVAGGSRMPEVQHLRHYGKEQHEDTAKL